MKRKPGLVKQIFENSKKNDPDNIRIQNENFDAVVRPHPRILIIDDDYDLLRILENNFSKIGFNIQIEADPVQGLRIAKSWLPDVILLDYMMPKVNGLEVCKALKTDNVTGSIPIILISAFSSLEQKLESFKAGVDDYVDKPFSVEELIARIYVQLRHRNSSSKQPQTEEGRLISVFSLRGGVGKSSIAVNLASSFATISAGKKIAIVDLVFLSGQIGLLLNTRSSKHWGGLIDIEKEALPSFILKDYFVSTGYHELYALLAPNNPIAGEKISVEAINTVLSYSKKNFPITVIDTPSNFDELTLAALDLSDIILLMLTPDIGGVTLAAKALNVINSLGYSKERVILIGNMVNEASVLTPDMLKQSLNADLKIVFSYNKKEFSIAQNLGKSLLELRPNCLNSKKFKWLANYINKYLVQLPSIKTEAIY